MDIAICRYADNDKAPINDRRSEVSEIGGALQKRFEVRARSDDNYICECIEFEICDMCSKQDFNVFPCICDRCVAEPFKSRTYIIVPIFAYQRGRSDDIYMWCAAKE